MSDTAPRLRSRRLGFTVTGYCPDDPADVKCCLTKQCTDKDGDGGVCLNNDVSQCDGTFVTGRCPGPKDVQCCVFDPSPSVPHTSEVDIYFWISAFIPLHMDGVTKAWPQDHSKTMVEAVKWLPVVGGCFLADERGFSDDDTASARMHSRAWVQVKADGYHWSQQHFCDETTEVKCSDGKVKNRKTQASDDMAFGLTSGSSDRVVLDFQASESNPLVPLAYKIDLVGTLTVDRKNKFVEFNGKVDEFPAFEAYVMINGRGPYTIAQLGPKAGVGPSALFGGANRPFQGRVYY